MAQLHLSGLNREVIMNWTIEKHKSPNALELKCNPRNETIEFFFNEINIVRFPEALESVMNNEQFGNQMSHLKPFETMDWEDIANAGEIKLGEIAFWSSEFGTTCIDKNTSYRLFSDFGHTLLELYKDDDSIQSQYEMYYNWRNENYSNDYLRFEKHWNVAMESKLIKLKGILQSDVLS